MVDIFILPGFLDKAERKEFRCEQNFGNIPVCSIMLKNLKVTTKLAFVHYYCAFYVRNHAKEPLFDDCGSVF